MGSAGYICIEVYMSARMYACIWHMHVYGVCLCSLCVATRNTCSASLLVGPEGMELGHFTPLRLLGPA